MFRILSAAFAFSLLALAPTFANEADVLSATIKETAPGVYTITAEVEHEDEGWDHYANAWQVLGPDGTVIATRELAHPHMNEQPFIRSLSGVKIPEGVTEVTIRARDLVHEFGGQEVTIEVPAANPSGS